MRPMAVLLFFLLWIPQRAHSGDATPPTLDAVDAMDHSPYVILTFSEAVGIGAQTPSNYDIFQCEHHGPCDYDLSVVSAAAEGNRVALTLSRSISGTYPVWFTVGVTGIQDLHGNTMEPSFMGFGTQPRSDFVYYRPKIAVHLEEHSGFEICGRQEPNTLNCSRFSPTGDTGRPYDAFLVVASNSLKGALSDAVLAIEYDENLAVGGWTLCTYGDIPQNGWPASGGGIRITGFNQGFCTGESTAEGTNAVLGALYVYAYGPSTMTVTPRNYRAVKDLSATDCTGTAHDLRESPTGIAGFGRNGYNPCSFAVPVARTTWGALKTRWLPVPDRP